MSRVRVLFFLSLFCGFVAGPALAIRAPGPSVKPDLDVRLPVEEIHRGAFVLRAPSTTQLALADVLKSKVQGMKLRWDGMSGSPKWISAPPGLSLSPPVPGSPEEAARRFFRDQAPLFGLESREVDGFRVTGVVPAPDGGAHVYFSQFVSGLEVFDGRANVNLLPDGSVRSVGTRLYRGVAVQTAPAIDAREAVRLAVLDVYPDILFTGVARSMDKEGERRAVFADESFGRSPEARLLLFPEANGVLLAWEVRVAETTLFTDYRILVDSTDGRILLRRNMTLYATARVLQATNPEPETEEFDPSQYQLVTIPSSTPESPSGWISGAGTSLAGNNASSHLQYWTAPGLTSPTGVYDFPYNTIRSALVNSWYWANDAHDRFYAAGFDEAAGNYQTDNFAMGGLGGDAMRVAHFANGGRNNAFYTTSVDGGTSTINFFWIDCFFCGDHDGYPENGPERAAGFMRDVVVHEYGHGVSTRMVGGPGADSCLFGIQSGGMGEGWSDIFAASFYDEPEIGGHFFEGSGWLRELRHDLTYDDLCAVGDRGCQVHDDGQIWGGTLWDLRQSMIALDPVAGQAEFDQIVVEGLANTVCLPTMIDARDGILDADTAAFASAHHTVIWNVFASRGMGDLASSTGENDSAPITDFSVPGGFGCTAPATPLSPSATPEGNNAIRLNYTATGASAVEVWREDLDNPFDRAQRIASTSSTSTFLDDTAQGGKSYRYHLVALGVGGVVCRSAASATADATAAGTCNAFPIFNPDLSAADGDPGCDLTFTWSAATEGCPGSGDPIVYNIYTSRLPGFYPSERNLAARTTSTSFVGAVNEDPQAIYVMVLAQHGTLADPPDHRNRGSAQVLEWVGSETTLGRTPVNFWDFETGPQGWTTNNAADPGGAWTLATPSPTLYGAGLFAPDQAAGGAGMAWVTGDTGGPSTSITERDSDGRNRLISPTWDGTGGATIFSFDYWSHVNGLGFGGMLLEVSNGIDPVAQIFHIALMTTQPFEADGRHGWQRYEVNLANFITPTTTMSVTLVSINTGTLSEFGVDNARVESGAICARSNLGITGLSVDDTTPGWGNGNGVAEAGETVRLTLTLANNGSTTAVAPVGRVVSPLPLGALVHESQDSFPDVPAGESRTSLGAGFTVTLPDATDCDEALTFSFHLTDASGTTSMDLADLEFGNTVTETIFEDDFETDKLWTVSGAVAGEGIWQRGDPVGTTVGADQANPEDCASGPATLCYVTENGAPAGDPDATDVDTVFPTLFSPLIDFTGYKRTRMFFDFWFFDDSTAASFFQDFGDYGAFVDDGIVGNGNTFFRGDPTGGWVATTADLTSTVPNVPDVRLFFEGLDRSPDHTVEIGVDNVLVQGDRMVCDPLGIVNPPNSVGDTLFVNKSGGNAEITWTASPTDVTHDAAAYYQVFVSGAPDSGFVVADTATVTTASRTLASPDEYYKLTAVNPAGTSGDEPLP